MVSTPYIIFASLLKASLNSNEVGSVLKEIPLHTSLWFTDIPFVFKRLALLNTSINSGARSEHVIISKCQSTDILVTIHQLSERGDRL